MEQLQNTTLMEQLQNTTLMEQLQNRIETEQAYINGNKRLHVS
jgi:hypothetical protein